QKINNIMESGYRSSFPYEYYDSLLPFISDSVLQPLKTSAKTYGTEAEYNWKLNAVWIYSFWSRRYKEGNIDEVFKILKEIQSQYAYAE
ncbi:MAG TPA: hypothetical protein VFR70_02370, partial [Flavobacterium sp.]|nr:hypothetical protein [Flavobacterium sp.]